ncbi:MAG: undecaprenyl-diphosphate phosphatase [Solirubrobacterales bacterium]
MSALEAIILGLVQGFTEFLPISSTAHLLFIPELAGWEDPGAAFTAITQGGTLAAVLIYFRVELVEIAVAWTRSLFNRDLRGTENARLGWFIVVGTVPIVIFGLIFAGDVETGARNLTLVAITMIALGLVLLLAEKLAGHTRSMSALTWRDAIIVGFAQALALVPGTSRSGATLTAGLFLGFKRDDAARYSFLLSIPSVFASGAYELGALVSEGTAIEVDTVPLVIATVIAFASGYATIAGLLAFLRTRSTMPFVLYRVVFGGLMLALIAAGAIG